MAEQMYVKQVLTLVENVRDLLESADPSTRVRGMRHVAEGIERIERCVVTEAHDGGMTWAEIGVVYEITRQSAHKQFASLPVASADVFAWLESDDEGEASPSLVEAGRRARQMVKTHRRVHHGAAH